MSKTLNVKDTILFDPRCFTHHLYRNRNRLREAVSDSEVSFELYRLGILMLVDKAENWPGSYRFKQAMNDCFTKSQLWNLCDNSIAKASRIRRHGC